MIRQATFERANRRKDKSVSFTFITSLEQTSEEFIEMDKLLGDTGIVYFKADGNLTQEEIDAIEEIDIEVEGKTKSQRLRNVLYVYHKESAIENRFSEFYADEMEKIIQHYKNKLDV